MRGVVFAIAAVLSSAAHADQYEELNKFFEPTPSRRPTRRSATRSRSPKR
jgi:hypothetical protein